MALGLKSITRLPALGLTQRGGGPLRISGAPSLATVGQPYVWSPSVSGGKGTRVFALTGSLPSGLSFNTATGAITGTPLATGTTSGLVVSVTDDTGTVALSGLFLVVAAALGPTTASFQVDAAAGSDVVVLTGLQPGETVASFSPNDGRLVLNAGATKFVRGASAVSAGVISLSVVTTLGRSLEVAVTASAASSLVPIGEQWGSVGDGIGSTAATGGIRNWPEWVQTYLDGRLMPSPGFNLHQSGGDMDVIYNDRLPVACALRWGVFIFGTQGHNDGLMTNDPDTNPIYINKWKRNLDYCIANTQFKANGGWCYYMLVMAAVPSNVAGEAAASSVNPAITRRQRVWQLQQEYVASKGLPQLKSVPTTYNPDTMGTTDPGNMQTHPDNQGGHNIAKNDVLPVLSPLVVPATADEMLALIRAGTYPGLVGSNLMVGGDLAGNTGVKAGTLAPTGEVPTGYTLTNNLLTSTSLSVVASKDDTPSTYKKAINLITGTPSAENTVAKQRTSAFTTATTVLRGQHALAALRWKIDDGAGGAPVGLVGLGLQVGSVGNLFAAGGNGGGSWGPPALDQLAFVPPKATFLNNTGANTTANLNSAIRVAAGAAQIRETWSDLIYYRVSTPTRGPAVCVAAAGTLSGNFLPRIGPAISAASGGSMYVEPGEVAPYGYTAGQKRVYKGGGAGGAKFANNIGAGTLLKTIASGDNWVTSFAAAELTQGDLLYGEIDVQGSDGVTLTIRTNAAVTVAV